VAGILACHLVFWDETGLSPIHYETKAPQKGAFFFLYPWRLERACHLVLWDETGLSPVHYETIAPQKGAFFFF
jgi:hypothetical protein